MSNDFPLHSRYQQQFAKAGGPLLGWYDANARILPWRETPLPYYVWISEIMLQQTRVEAVKPYFDRFITALPDIPSLSRAPEELLLKLWEGLGYYNRVRNLNKAAQIVVKEYNSQLPPSFEKLLQLPGIGRYTAGAVASIAYGLPVPAVDGNVLRVVCRCLEIEEDIAKESTKRAMESLLLSLIPQERPGAYNQALMELGATVCLPNGAPKCLICPLRELCLANRSGLHNAYPVKSPKKARVWEEKTLFLLFCGKNIALCRRPKTGLLAGMWEFPGVPGFLSEAEASDYLSSLSLHFSPLHELPPSVHIFTHKEWHMKAYAAVLKENFPIPGWEWHPLNTVLRELALPSAFRTYKALMTELCRELEKEPQG